MGDIMTNRMRQSTFQFKQLFIKLCFLVRHNLVSILTIIWMESTSRAFVTYKYSARSIIFDQIRLES